MSAILMKPCQPDHLIAELQRVLQHHHQQQRSPSSTAQAPTPGRSTEAKFHS
jgi:hypothetical protein